MTEDKYYIIIWSDPYYHEHCHGDMTAEMVNGFEHPTKYCKKSEQVTLF